MSRSDFSAFDERLNLEKKLFRLDVFGVEAAEEV